MLTNIPPITLLDIQNEFSAGSLAAASTAAGLDPLPTSMLDFLGKSAANYVSEYGGDATAISGTSKPASISVAITTGGSFTVSLRRSGFTGGTSFFPYYTPTRWINPTSKAADVYASLWVRCTATYSLSAADGGAGNTAYYTGPGLIGESTSGDAVGSGYATINGTEVGSWLLLSDAAAGNWVAAASFVSGSTADCSAIVDWTIDISTSNGGPIVASNTYYVEVLSRY